METDSGLEPTRNIRKKISREFGNDPRRLVEYYMKYQRRFADRLLPPPDADQNNKTAAEQADAADRPSASR